MGSEDQVNAADADDLLSDEEWNRIQHTLYNRDRACRGQFISETNHRPEPTGEYFRWYEYGGNPRLEPLTREELIDYYGSESSYIDSLDQCHDAAFTEADWEVYKTQFLGNLKAPLALLQRIVSEEEGHWRDSIYPIADWCGTTQEPNPRAVYRAISEAVWRADWMAEVHGEVKPFWYEEAKDNLVSIQENYPEIPKGKINAREGRAATEYLGYYSNFIENLSNDHDDYREEADFWGSQMRICAREEPYLWDLMSSDLNHPYEKHEASFNKAKEFVEMTFGQDMILHPPPPEPPRAPLNINELLDDDEPPF